MARNSYRRTCGTRVARASVTVQEDTVMTPIAGFFLAIIAGWIVREPRRAAATVILPYLALVVVQTWGLANGYGINPPSSVTPLSGALSYYVVQLIFLVTTVVIAASLAVVCAARGGGLPVGPWYRAAVAAAVGTTGVLVLLTAWIACASLVRVHSSAGTPPVQGLAGMGLSVIGCVVLGVAAIRVIVRRRTAVRRETGLPETAAADLSRPVEHQAR